MDIVTYDKFENMDCIIHDLMLVVSEYMMLSKTRDEMKENESRKDKDLRQPYSISRKSMTDSSDELNQEVLTTQGIRRLLNRKRIPRQHDDASTTKRCRIDSSISDCTTENESPAFLEHLTPEIRKNLSSAQVEAISFMFQKICDTKGILHNREGSGCILGNGIGTGKSLIIISLWKLVEVFNKALRTLILCPCNAINNWALEISKWIHPLPENVYVLNDSCPTSSTRKMKCEKWFNRNGLIIMSYHLWRKLAAEDTLGEILLIGPQIVFLDEGHVLKNPNTILYKMVKKIQCKTKIIISGTIVQNSVHELYSITTLVNPGSMGQEGNFLQRFSKRISQLSTTNQEHLAALISSKALKEMLHTTFCCTSNQLVGMPSKEDWILTLHPTKVQINLYHAYISEILPLQGISEHKFVGAMQADAVLSRLMCHPDILFNEYKEEGKYRWAKKYFHGYKPGVLENGTKFLACLSILNNAISKSEKVVVFSTYITTLNMLETFLKKDLSTIIYERIDGTSGYSQRKNAVEKFNNSDDCHLLLISSKAGGESINLIGAAILLLLDVNWNPAIDEQSAGRACRFGCNKSSLVLRLAVKDTLDELKLRRQVMKSQIGNYITDKDCYQFWNERRSLNTFDFLESLRSFPRVLQMQNIHPDSPEYAKELGDILYNVEKMSAVYSESRLFSHIEDKVDAVNLYHRESSGNWHFPLLPERLSSFLPTRKLDQDKNITAEIYDHDDDELFVNFKVSLNCIVTRCKVMLETKSRIVSEIKSLEEEISLMSTSTQ